MTSGPEWEDGTRRLLETLRAALADASDDAGGECRWCPHCQVRAVVRGERPEVTAALADVLATTAGALRAFAAAPRQPAPDPGPDPSSEVPPQAAEEPAPAGPAVQRTELA